MFLHIFVKFILQCINAMKQWGSVAGCDGTSSAATEVRAGANGVQIYTGLIYRGPALVREVALALKSGT